MSDDNESTTSSVNSAARHNRWIDRLQEKQEKLAGNRAELRRIIEYQRQVGTDEKKQATLAGILAAENGVPGDEWRARLAESERHQQYVTRSSRSPTHTTSRSRSSSPPTNQPRPQQAGGGGAAPTTARSSSATVTFNFPASSSTHNQNQQLPSGRLYHHHHQPSATPSTQPQHSIGGGGVGEHPTTCGSSGAEKEQKYFPYSSQDEAERRKAEAKALAEREAALRIKLAKDHVNYVEAVHAREDVIREKSQQTREAALLHEVIAARNECRRHVSEAEMSSRNQEDLMRVVTALKKQLSETTKELEYARKEIDFTGRECQVKKSESQDLRVELALLRKANEKLDYKLKKREDLIVQLEREKADVLLDCKKLIRDKQEADDRVTKMTAEFNDQQKQFEDFRREAAVAPHFRAGAPSPMIFEAHRRVSPSQHSRDSTNNRPSSSASTRSKSPFVGRNGSIHHNNNIHTSSSATSSCNMIQKKDLDLLLRDLYADLSSCPLLRRAVCWDSARSGPQVLPIWFDRAMWENVKRKASIQDNEEVSTTSKRHVKKSKDHHQSQKENHYDDADDEEDQQSFPYNSYDEYKKAMKKAARKKYEQQQETTKPPFTTFSTSSKPLSRMESPNKLLQATTCRRCGHSHHCHHRCHFCDPQQQQGDLQHDRAERAHIIRTKSPLKSVLKKPQQQTNNLPPKTAVIVSSSSGAEASDEREITTTQNKKFIDSAEAAQQRLEKIAAKIDGDCDQQEDDSNQVSPMTSKGAAGEDDDDQQQQQQETRGESSASTATSFGVSRPFKQYVASADQLAREARRGNRFVSRQ